MIQIAKITIAPGSDAPKEVQGQPPFNVFLIADEDDEGGFINERVRVERDGQPNVELTTYEIGGIYHGLNSMMSSLEEALENTK